MEKYVLFMELNRRQILGEEMTNEEKKQAVSVFLNGVSDREKVLRYKKSMRVNPETDNTYPNYYIPPYNDGKKLRMIQGTMPKTHILHANYYELEIIRLLHMFAPDNPAVKEIVQKTLQRLQNTCYGNGCTKGECYATGKIVLRFLKTVCPEDAAWINKLSGALE